MKLNSKSLLEIGGGGMILILFLSEEEWVSATDDMVWTLDNNGIGEKEKNEVITILESFKGDVVGV